MILCFLLNSCVWVLCLMYRGFSTICSYFENDEHYWHHIFEKIEKTLFCSSLHCCHLLQLLPAFSWVLRVVLHLINSPNPNTISGTIVQPAPSCILPAPWKSRREIQTNWNETFMLLLSPVAVIEVSASQCYICPFGKAHRSTFQRLWNVLTHDIRTQVKQCMNRTYIYISARHLEMTQSDAEVGFVEQEGRIKPCHPQPSLPRASCIICARLCARALLHCASWCLCAHVLHWLLNYPSTKTAPPRVLQPPLHILPDHQHHHHNS